MKISSVILTKNEEENIKTAIESVSFTEETIVIDDYSKDNTIDIARNLGARVFKRNLGGDFASQRNYGLAQARGEWVLFVDADEKVTNRLKNEIIQAVNDPLRSEVAHFIKRKDFFLGKGLDHGEVGGAKFIRLAKRNSGNWERKVHETWQVDGKTCVLKNPILHYPHPTLSEFILDLNFTSTIHAEENKAKSKKTSLLKIILWPKLKFLVNYFIKGGFLDGTHGFVLALLMSFHSFLAWSKQWLLQKDLQKKQ